MSMPHTCRCGTCGYELSPMFITGLSNGTRPPLAAEPVGQMPFKLPVRTDTSPDGVMFVVDAAREILILDVRAHYADAIVTALNSLPTLQSDLAQARTDIEIRDSYIAGAQRLYQTLQDERDKLQADLTEARRNVELAAAWGYEQGAQRFIGNADELPSTAELVAKEVNAFLAKAKGAV